MEHISKMLMDVDDKYSFVNCVLTCKFKTNNNILTRATKADQ